MLRIYFHVSHVELHKSGILVYHKCQHEFNDVYIKNKFQLAGKALRKKFVFKSNVKFYSLGEVRFSAGTEFHICSMA